MLCISAVSVVTSPFSFLILLIWVFSLFFLMSLASGLSILFIFSKNQLLVLLFCYCFLHFFFIYFWSDLYDFFPSANFGVFCSSFSNCFRCKLRLELFLWGKQKERHYYGMSGFLYLVGAFLSLSRLLGTVLVWSFPVTSSEGQISPGSWVTPKLPVDLALRKGNFQLMLSLYLPLLPVSFAGSGIWLLEMHHWGFKP